MTTFTQATPISMANSAALQALGSELHGWLIGIGLVNTTDTGQINWATVTLPAANTLIGYEIWAFPDLSIYFKLQWTTGTSATNTPAMAITVGTGSNGSGTITGQTSTSNTLTSAAGNTAITNTATNVSTYICLTSDAFWIVWKALSSNASTNPAMAFCIEKTVDSSGTVSSLGFLVTTLSTVASASNKQAVRTATTAATFTLSNSFCAVPGNVTSSLNAAGSHQVFMHQYPIPDILLSNVTCTVVAADAALGTTFTTTLVGTSSQTMISAGNQMGTGNSSSALATWSTALRWQ